jgi:hypothetical protein
MTNGRNVKAANADEHVEKPEHAVADLPPDEAEQSEVQGGGAASTSVRVLPSTRELEKGIISNFRV